MNWIFKTGMLTPGREVKSAILHRSQSSYKLFSTRAKSNTQRQGTESNAIHENSDFTFENGNHWSHAVSQVCRMWQSRMCVDQKYLDSFVPLATRSLTGYRLRLGLRLYVLQTHMSTYCPPYLAWIGDSEISLQLCIELTRLASIFTWSITSRYHSSYI